jgi:hypothetical protein
MGWGAASRALGIVSWFVLVFSGFGLYSIFPVEVTEYTWSQPAAAILFIAALPRARSRPAVVQQSRSQGVVPGSTRSATAAGLGRSPAMSGSEANCG